MRVVIVDDEPLARRGVRIRLKANCDMDVVAECGSGVEAAKSIRNLAPDLVFLDIQMPDLNGFDVLRRLPPQELPLVVFVTAYDEFALAAFEAHALDYLLKPIDDVRFEHALKRARMLNASHALGEMSQRVGALLDSLKQAHARPQYRTHITVKTGRRLRVVSVSEIDWFGADGDYVNLHVNNKEYLVRQTISSLERELDPEHFLRIHRSTIVSTAQIAELTSLDSEGFLVRLRNGRELKTSRSFRSRLGEWL